MSTRTPEGVVVERPRSLDVLGLVDAWCPLVTVRAVGRNTVVWIDPLTCTVALTPFYGAPRGRGARDGVTRIFRSPTTMTVGQSWFVEVLYEGGWKPVAVTRLRAISVVRFDEPEQP